MNPSRGDATVIAYIHRAQHLIARIGFRANTISPLVIAERVISIRPTVRPATWRQYRSALICYFQQLEHAHPEKEPAIALLRTSGCSECLRGGNAPSRTSSSKKRQVKPEDLSEIVGYLSEHETRWSFPTSMWLEASVLTGLRPSEWQSARLELGESGEPVLVITNAKNSNGRANGDQRTLLLANLPETNLALISVHLGVVAEMVGRNLWDRYYRECRKTLYKATRALWPKRISYPTLYSGRHQFSADAKRSGLSKIEVAALMGHASEETAGRHYGKKRSGRNGFSILPNPADITRLKLSFMVSAPDLDVSGPQPLL